MRLKLTLQSPGSTSILPINYQYELSSWIYKVIHFGNEEFARWLHEHGYMDGNKKFKFFTFSNLVIDKYKTNGDRLEILGEHSYLYISFYAEEAVEPFIIGLFKNQEFSIGDRKSRVNFRVGSIEKLPEPDWKETMNFRTQSPVVISIKENETAKTATYLSPEDPRFEELFIKNLISKYVALLKQENKGMHLLNFQSHNISMKVNGKVKSKAIRIKVGTPDETLIKGSLFDFSITAPVELVRLGYFGGFGEKNSLGMGSVR